MCDRVKNIDFSVQRCKTSENTLDIDLIFSPLDSEGRLVKAHGVLDVKLWRQKRAASESDVLLDHWVGLQITSGTYDKSGGSLVQLHYFRESEAHPAFLQSSDLGQSCGDPVTYDSFVIEANFSLDENTYYCRKEDINFYIIVNE